ncbi:prepilin-type N-terminal cleavage/methylation domain-containing protein [Stutzerimonas stutzeri]|uniref:PilW family protein n=1 Tax=Stutzerimonas sp. S1 TaxID=3030652 RepID=UPI00222597AD|nr:prepilin-type N-terminal cleavage/methylation domain-containing protein [Stutzerimonas sp. S1]MCW3147087.1 prepilin-type N-terminal cleavage/methylation domain-containing protein [Stutzerimonas sp. S1]
MSTYWQHGLSMIELLVALAISSFLLLGISQIYLDNKRTHLFQQSQAGNQENSRFAALMLNEYLAKAGYRRAPDQLIEDAFPEKTYAGCKQFGEGSALSATNDGLGICLRYQPVFSGELDCQGNASPAFTDTTAFKAAPASSLIVLAIKYVPGTEPQNLDAGTLECSNLTADNPSYVELLTGVADFRLEFGVGGADLLEKKLTEGSGRFVSSATWSENDGPIRAVRYSMLLASRENQRDGESLIYSNWYDSADATTKARLAEGDKSRIYQVANGTQTIRNLMP